MNPDIFQYLARGIVLLTAIPVHESAHAYVSYKLGDPTAKNLGRLSLNPLRHFDVLGCVSMLIIGIGWAKPVPIDPRYYKNPKAGMALSALAGPVSNFLMAFVAMIFYKIALFSYAASGGSQIVRMFAVLLQAMVLINISLGIFNLIPVPPFDGSRIFGFFLPEHVYWGIMKYERYIFFAVLALLFFGVLNTPLLAANNALFTAFDFLTRPVDILMSAVTGFSRG